MKNLYYVFVVFLSLWILGPAKFIAECNGQVYDDYSAMAVMRVTEDQSLGDLLLAAGEDPDFENEDYVYAVVCGVFLSSDDDRKEVMDKMLMCCKEIRTL